MSKQQVALIHSPNYEQIKKDFLHELVLASRNKPSSISFLKNILPEKPLVTEGLVQGIVIGGTNYITATEEIKTDGRRKILKKKTGILPIFDSKTTFERFLLEHIDQSVEAIGINFGFPMHAQIGSTGEIDGILIQGTKEHTFKGLLNASLGNVTKNLYKKKFHKTPKVSIANDTICLARSGDGNENGSLIAGTGFNMCILSKEKNNRILVNLEAGNFNKFALSPTLKEIDANSEDPGGYLLEKAISGKYLAINFNKRIAKHHPEISPISTSQDLSELSHSNHTDVAGDLARAIITRSAYLVASAIAAAYEFKGKNKAFTLIGEGSLLWNGWHYQENIYKQLHKLGVPEGRILLKHVQDSSINGAIGLITK